MLILMTLHTKTHNKLLTFNQVWNLESYVVVYATFLEWAIVQDMKLIMNQFEVLAPSGVKCSYITWN